MLDAGGGAALGGVVESSLAAGRRDVDEEDDDDGDDDEGARGHGAGAAFERGSKSANCPRRRAGIATLCQTAEVEGANPFADFKSFSSAFRSE